MLNDYNVPAGAPITAQSIIDEFGKSDIGTKTLSDMNSLPERIMLTYERRNDGVRGIQEGNRITIYLDNCKNDTWAARSLIHEITHYKYGIGQSQWAECVCVAQEFKHARNREKLTINELRTIIKAVREAYPEYDWRKGGIINGKRKSH